MPIHFAEPIPKRPFLPRFLILMAFAVLMTSTGCVSEQKKDESKELAVLHLKIGTGHLAKKNYPLALRELLKAEKLDPTNPVILNNLGLAYYVREQTTDALRKLRRAVKVRPDFTEARNNVARVLIDLGKFDEARAELKTVTSDLLYAQPEKGWYNLGLADFRQKKFDDAKKSLLKAIRLKRDYCPAFTLYGRTLFEQKLFEEAASSLDQAVAVCKNQSFEEADFYAALSHLKLGRKNQARAKMEEVIRHYPTGKFAKKARSYLEMIK